MNSVEIKTVVKDFILNEFLPGENPDNLGNDMELISAGILDSLATLRLVAFLEETFGIETEPHELDPDNLNSIDLIAAFVEAKRG